MSDSLELVKYVIHESEDNTQSGVMTLDNWNRTPALQLDVNDKPMVVIRIFSATSWNAAMQVYNDHYGYGIYKPMEEN